MRSVYWDRVAGRRIGRRRAIIGTAGFAGSIAALAACGGGDNGDGTAETELVNKPADETARAVKGGIFQSFDTADSPNLDPLTGSASTHAIITSSLTPALASLTASSTGGEEVITPDEPPS